MGREWCYHSQACVDKLVQFGTESIPYLEQLTKSDRRDHNHNRLGVIAYLGLADIYARIDDVAAKQAIVTYLCEVLSGSDQWHAGFALVALSKIKDRRAIEPMLVNLPRAATYECAVALGKCGWSPKDQSIEF
jgi:hypothetical protein